MRSTSVTDKKSEKYIPEHDLEELTVWLLIIDACASVERNVKVCGPLCLMSLSPKGRVKMPQQSDGGQFAAFVVTQRGCRSEVKLMITKVPGSRQRFVDDATAHLSFGENREKFAELYILILEEALMHPELLSVLLA
ncbi:hypothetical protein Anapl_17874 [Anas platyrhynchos]|uniref:Uncharacterized protein n=1 Tax=Anas platyrhynchos TaxID=8839 RepID=R0J7X8_ANAPL|nr:hypothetical protein Anapl_17874 [Anas platyrhynchos]